MSSARESPRIAIFCDCRLTPRDAVSNSIVDMFEALKSRGVAVTLAARANHRDPLIPCLEIRDESDLKALLDAHTHLIYHYTIGDELSAAVNAAASIRKAFYFHGVTPPELLESDAPEIAKLCRNGLSLLGKLNQFQVYLANSRYNAQLLPDAPEAAGPLVIPPYLHLPKAGAAKPARPDSYLLYLGRFFPHKNVEAVIEFFADAREEDPALRLILAGAQSADVLLTADAYLKKLRAGIVQLGLVDAVEFRFNRSDEECAALIAGSRAMMSFSLHEGFGVPLVESLANRVPVITHRVAAIPEVMGDAAFYVEDDRSAVETYRRLLRDRDAIAARGWERYQKLYSDARVRQRFWDFIQEFIDPRNP